MQAFLYVILFNKNLCAENRYKDYYLYDNEIEWRCEENVSCVWTCAGSLPSKERRKKVVFLITFLRFDEL